MTCGAIRNRNCPAQPSLIVRMIGAAALGLSLCWTAAPLSGGAFAQGFKMPPKPEDERPQKPSPEATTKAFAAMRAGRYGEAAALFRQGAREGDVNAFYMLGVMHQTGQGARKNFRDAAILFQHAAQKGHKRAQLKLGDLFAQGLGMKRDAVRGYMWLEVAALQYEMEALEKRNRLAVTMTQADIDLARKLALACLQSKYAQCDPPIAQATPANAVNGKSAGPKNAQSRKPAPVKNK
ncbi:MAG: tetratricopeptide repeat protein [Beijerinckiaceae bacterium]